MRNATRKLIEGMKQVRMDIVTAQFLSDYFVEVFDDKGIVIDHVNLHSHCLACAKTDYMAKYGRLVDIRGWQKQGMCGAFLKSMRMVTEEEKES